MTASAIRHLALIGNYLPRRCGLATFTTDTHVALQRGFPDLRVDVYAMDDHPGRYAYPDGVTATIAQDDRRAYVKAAQRIADSGAQALWVQHEFGIYGGPAGEYLIGLLEQLTIPVVVTLHTILEHPNPDERRVMEALLRRASRLIVMAERGRDILRRVHDVDDRRIVVIPHGVPDRPLADTAAFKPAFGWEARDVILTFGLLAPNKGIETMIEALPSIVRQHPNALYVILGATHPNLVAHEGEKYRERLMALANSREVGGHVAFIDAFVEQAELLDYLQAADLYVTPYSNPAQITSGTLSFAVGLGKAVISTPYVHATEILDRGHGVLVDFNDSAGFAQVANNLLSDVDARQALSARAYARGRTMLWARVAEAAVSELDAALAEAPHKLSKRRPEPVLLSPSLAAVDRMTDGTGILQHAIHSVPDRRHGYCIDDNARALILMCRMAGAPAEDRDRLITLYAAFVQHAWNPDLRCFRNFMHFDRSWCEDQGSEDSNGRALWSLGVAARDAGFQKHQAWASALFDSTASVAFTLGSPRAQAFAILGAAAMLEAHPGHRVSSEILRQSGGALGRLLERVRRPDWPWFETVLAYDNARLPEAMIRAGRALHDGAMLSAGLETLHWILEQQTAPEGWFRAIGTESFGQILAPPSPFDQQPLEAQAVIDACAAAYEATEDAIWLAHARRAYRWYLGGNDLSLPLATFQDGGCYDGLMPTGLNRNQGAESILALQLANCTMASLAAAEEKRTGSERAVA